MAKGKKANSKSSKAKDNSTSRGVSRVGAASVSESSKPRKKKRLKINNNPLVF